MDIWLNQVDRSSPTPLYEQLYLEMKETIIRGDLVVGTKLPSKRQLAEFLNLSQTTIELAYGQLVAEGFIKAVARSGYYVEQVEELAFTDEMRMKHDQPETFKHAYSIDFNSGRIDTSSFPFNQWRKYAKDVLDETSRDLLLLGHPQGDVELRQEIAHYLYSSRGVRCTAQQIVIGSGTEQLMPLLIRLLGKQIVFAIENPGYPMTHHIFANYDRETVAVPVDEDGMQVAELEKKQASVAYVTPSHQFPTGAILSASRRVQLLNWASAKEGRYIIEDDYDSEFRYVGKPIPSLQGMDQSERVIYISTFSKSLMPSLRIAYFVLPMHLLQAYRVTFPYYSSTVPRLDQHVLAQFMRDGHFSKHLNRMRKLYRKKLEKLTQALDEYRPTVHISGEQAGMHIVLTVDSESTDRELVELAKQQDIRVYALSDYHQPTQSIPSRPQVLIGFGGFEEEAIEPAVEALMNAWHIKKA
ncbi:PLP-dependent aminotransferase family protein [Paenisporosarcina sp. NPDC076898]|uniref:MocR-like pyridoxine biosynthesis transcription factor PdxR n=1 Tax=unclassified Paenisporosarcina TaxID=2642018 RepID=UPI003CFDF531